MKEENVEDEVTHHQLRGLEKNRSCSKSISVKNKPIGKEGIINLQQNLHQNLYHHLHHNLPQNLH